MTDDPVPSERVMDAYWALTDAIQRKATLLKPHHCERAEYLMNSIDPAILEIVGILRAEEIAEKRREQRDA